MNIFLGVILIVGAVFFIILAICCFDIDETIETVLALLFLFALTGAPIAIILLGVWLIKIGTQ